MAAIDDHLREVTGHIAKAHQRLMGDTEKLRATFKDWSRADLEIRIRWAQYTLEVADLERTKLNIMRAMEQVANVATPEAYQSVNG